MMATLASLNVSTFVEKARRITAATSTWASRWKRLDVQAGYREHMCTVLQTKNSSTSSAAVRLWGPRCKQSFRTTCSMATAGITLSVYDHASIALDTACFFHDCRGDTK